MIRQISRAITFEILVTIWGETVMRSAEKFDCNALTASSSESDVTSFIRKARAYVYELRKHHLPLNLPLFNELTSSIGSFENDLKDLSSARLQYYSKTFFSSRYPNAEISFLPKSNGRQLGAIVRVGDSRFYTKTHSFGTASKSRSSTAVKAVSAVEMLMYTVLQNFGIGCESFVFGKDSNTCYIATRDASAYGKFSVYRGWQESREVVGDGLFAGLSQGLADDGIDKLVMTDSRSSMFVEGILLLHFICRMFALDDLFTNHGNFGFVIDGSNLSLKIIDFTESSLIAPLDSLQSRAFYHADVSTRFDCGDEACRFCLRGVSADKRADIIGRFFDTIFMSWEEVLDRSVHELLTQFSCFVHDTSKIRKDAEDFISLVSRNMKLVCSERSSR